MSVLNNCWAGKFRSAYNEYVTCGAYAAFNFIPGLNQFSVQAWFTSIIGGNGDITILSRGFNNTSQYGIKLNGNVVKISVGGTQYSFNITSLLGIVVNNGEWHHIVVSWDLASFKLYIDGQLASTKAFTSSTTYAVDLIIGGVRNTNLSDITDVYDGLIDEVGIWHTNLSDSEALALYNDGLGLMLDDNSGNYVSSASLDGWWRMGDGSTENAGSTPTAIIYDESENGHNGTLYSDSMNLNVFYYGGNHDLYPVPGKSYCVFLFSSSSVIPEVGNTFTVTRSDQGNLRDRVGFEGSIHRMVLDCTSTPGTINKIFVYETGRPYPGVSLRQQVFRRVATLNDLVLIPEDIPNSRFPFAFRKSTAEIFAPTAALLNQAWLEIQRQCATLSLDMQEFGAPSPVAGGSGAVLRGGIGEASEIDRETFGAPEPWSATLQQSSSAELIIPSSSSSILIPQYSSSSAWVGHSVYTLLNHKDAATRLHQDAGTTLFNNLGFIRFGRNAVQDAYWDSFLRFLIDIPKCAKILSAFLILNAHTSESGEDIVLRIRDIYKSDGSSVDYFDSVDDPAIARSGMIWDKLVPTNETSVLFPVLNIAELLQYFIDRDIYTPGTDYFGLWIEEVVSDIGARRDATVSLGVSPTLVVNWNTDRECESSSLTG